MYDRGAPVEAAFPFLDRRLTEFCLGVPSDQLVRPGEMRSLHRRALAEARFGKAGENLLALLAAVALEAWLQRAEAG